MANDTVLTAPHVHFTGIKGVGMTAAALCIQDLGHTVSGSDVEEDFVTQHVLSQRSIIPQAGFKSEHIPPETTLLIYTGAHNGDQNPEVIAAKARGIRAISHAVAVGELMAGKTGISICGVGGKTSTSAMIANIFEYAGLDPSFLIGVGKVLNLQVPGRLAKGAHFIAEADEYAISPGHDNTPRFMPQTPHLIICTNVAHDHPDVYPNIDATKSAFKTFFNIIPKDGLLVLNGNSGPLRQIDVTGLPVLWYGVTPNNNDWWIENSFTGESKQMVTIAGKSGEKYQFTLSVPGIFNAANALASFLVAKHLGVDPKKILEALQLFRGSMRRFEKVGEMNGTPLYDDYAHHPSQIFATLQAARQWLPLYKIVALFQPHTYSRTKVFKEQFAKSFTFADRVIITDIYASAREAVDESISGYQLAEAVKRHHPSVSYIPRDQLVSALTSQLTAQDALFTLGAGDIYQLHQDLIT
jgi:UDP-N-acetylmuramate--alanine ligase